MQRSPWILLVGAAGLTTILASAGSSPTESPGATAASSAVPAPAPAEAAAELVGAETCAGCHDVGDQLSLGPHGSEAFARASAHGCETCHGPGSAHVEDPEDAALQPRIERFGVLDRSRICQSCHGDDQGAFAHGPHAAAGMSCVDCHAIHSEEPTGWARADPDTEDHGRITEGVSGSSALCVDCHGDVAAEFAFNESHRLREGILTCTSCHDPHAPERRLRLGGFRQEKCLDCHTDKGGPFVFEHASSRFEGCVSCHVPHGAPNRHLLKFQRVAEVCYSCHATVPSFHFGFSPTGPPRFGLDTQCTNCHSTIHGSNFDAAFLK